MKKADIKKVEEYLDERWEIWETFERTNDFNYYSGLTKMVTLMEYHWVRDNVGKHKLIKF